MEHASITEDEAERIILASCRKYSALALVHLKVNVFDIGFKCNIQGKTAGYATCRKGLLRFNRTLLAHEGEWACDKTAGHEVAHIVAYRRWEGRKILPHGSEWSIVMHVFGLPVARCHGYDYAAASAARR